MNLFSEFKKYVQEESLFEPKHKLLVTLSGGPDSMVLLELLLQLGQQIEVAHANFQLRGAESEEETAFVKSFCAERGIKLHIKYMDTKAYMENFGIGVQEAARNLRYQWFEELRETNKLDFIVLAHHANDQVETMVFHLLRGAGSKGLAGIMPKVNHIRRPLLFASRAAIMNYAAQNKIPYRTDSSNLKEDYTRNFIRQQIIPQFERIEKGYLNNMLHTAKIMAATHHYYQAQIDLLKLELLSNESDRTEINLKNLTTKAYPSYLLFELLKPFDFNFEQCEEMLHSFENKNTGAIFLSDNFRGLINRETLLVSPYNNEIQAIEISSLPQSINIGRMVYQFSLATFEGFEENVMWLDADLLALPLAIRPINKGDKFKPLGLVHFQKVSDYLINKKINRFEKEQVFALANNSEIVALLPYQISDDYKINSDTKSFLKIEIKKGSTK